MRKRKSVYGLANLNAAVTVEQLVCPQCNYDMPIMHSGLRNICRNCGFIYHSSSEH